MKVNILKNDQKLNQENSEENHELSQLSFLQSKEVKIYDSSKGKDKNNNEENNKKNIISKVKDKRKANFFIRNITAIQKFIRLIFEILCLILNIISIKYYLTSLEGCKNSRAYCLRMNNLEYFVAKAILCIKCGICLTFIIYMGLFKVISEVSVLYSLGIYSGIFFYDHYKEFEHHGYFNFLMLVITVCLLLPILLYIYFLVYLVCKKRIKMLFTIIGITALIVLTLYKLILDSYTCKNYGIGLNGVKIDNDPEKYPCYFDNPSKCLLGLMGPFMDVSFYTGDTCETLRDQTQQKKYFTYFLIPEKKYEKTRRFGFPITTGNPYFSLRTQNGIKDFNEKVSQSVVDMDKRESKTPKPEVVLEFDDNNIGKIHINIEKNEALSKERKILAQKSKSTFKNILFVFIDSLSRVHFQRKLKRLSNFIEVFMEGSKNKNRNKYDTENYKSYQFMKYHPFDSFTQMSMQPMFYGEKMAKASSNGTHIIKYMKEQGYITGQSTDLCSRELFVTMNNCLNKVEFSDFDHENVAMFCDANYYNRESPYPFLQGGFSIMRRCLYGRDAFEYVIEYAEKFWETYKDDKKFFRLGFIDAHERTGEVIKYLDGPLTDFLERLYKKKLLEDTAIIFLSDHGNGMHSIFRKLKAEDYWWELTLGHFFMILHGYKDKEGIENLHLNEQVFITPYDLHDTMSHIIFGEVNKKVHTRNNWGQSIFTKIDPMKRTCKNYMEFPRDDVCHCRIKGQKMSTIENKVKEY